MPSSLPRGEEYSKGDLPERSTGAGRTGTWHPSGQPSNARLHFIAPRVSRVPSAPPCGRCGLRRPALSRGLGTVQELGGRRSRRRARAQRRAGRTGPEAGTEIAGAVIAVFDGLRGRPEGPPERSGAALCAHREPVRLRRRRRPAAFTRSPSSVRGANPWTRCVTACSPQQDRLHTGCAARPPTAR